MSLSRTHETGMQSTAPPSRRDRDRTGSAGSGTLFAYKRSSKPFQANGKKDSHSSGPARSLPLGDHANGLKNRSHQDQPRGDKDHRDIYTFGEAPTPQNGVHTTPNKTRRTENTTSTPFTTPFTTPSRPRTKRRRVTTIETSDSEEIVNVVEESARAANGSINGTESGRRVDQRSNGAPMRCQDSGLFPQKPPTLNHRLSEAELDSFIYGQPGAPKPPPGSLFADKGPTRRRQDPGISNGLPPQAVPSLHLHIDPRIHWTHPKSEVWHGKKQEEIRFRGTRKTNSGRAVQRMQEKRIRETLINEVLPTMPTKHDTRFGRPVDFGDVPEAELPEMVKSNPEWLKATAWMRKCREKSLERQKEMERRKKAGLPWKGLLGASGIK